MEERQEITSNQTSVISWLRMARIVQKIERAAALHLRQWQLSLAQFDVLAQAGASQGMTQQELADTLLVTKGNISQLLDKMEQTGLLARKQEKGRTYRIYLTPSGQALFDEVVPRHEAFITGQLSALPSQEQKQLLGLLRKLDHSLKF